ncbi:hypothetical protein [Porphyromonas sp. HMSC065F10]|uniref:hypothetical protein n=1 Tax=Porphyromonas sp. HMSC065F10 TaxID=1739394 RepID=UPI000B17A67E|nr:hypothetical protein [Porphyromonas sp. HMSC065F10]
MTTKTMSTEISFSKKISQPFSGNDSEMEANNIINGLKHLSEGLFLPEEWIDWWKQNEKIAKQFLSSRWYLKIKPKMSQGLIGATLISQNAAREYLKSINQSYNENSQINYMEGWSKQIDNISLNYDKVYMIDFDLKFTKLKQNYPNLFAAIKKTYCNMMLWKII